MVLGLGETDSLLMDKYFQLLASANTDFIFLVDPVDFKVRYINHLPNYLTSKELLGMDVFEFVAPAHKETYRSFLQSVAASATPQSIELESSDHVIGKPKGKEWYSCSGFPVKNESGQTESILVITKNITSSKLHAIEMLDKEEKLFAILNNTSDVILSIDRDYRLTEFNTVFRGMALKGFGVKDPYGTPVLNYLDPTKYEHLKEIYSKVLEGEIINDIAQFNTRSGLTVYNETSYHPIRNFNQEITGISIFSKDITQRVLNEQKLKSTLKEREVLLAEIHHRIKNNLALVSSMLQLKEINIENESAKEALRDSRKRIKSTALVHEMLYRNDSFDQVLMQEYLTELFDNLHTNPGIKLAIEGDNPVLDLNRALPFGLMMHELMMNSIKHSFKNKEQGVLELKSKLINEVLEIEYCDYEGVFPEEVDFRDTSSTGLMLIHTFIEQLNGSIELENRTPPRYRIKIPMT
jgi:PAS domain S-box-containing protein